MAAIHGLDTIEPETAVELYLSERQDELSEATNQAHRSRLGFFLRWSDERDVTNLNILTGRMLQEYRLWRRDEWDIANITLRSQMATLRVFIKWCEDIDAVEHELFQKVRVPTLKDGEKARDVMLDGETAAPILEYLGKYEYASFTHVTMGLLWHTMMRRGSARALDVGGLHSRRAVHRSPAPAGHGNAAEEQGAWRAAGRPGRLDGRPSRRLDSGPAAGRHRRARPRAVAGDRERPGALHGDSEGRLWVDAALRLLRRVSAWPGTGDLPGGPELGSRHGG